MSLRIPIRIYFEKIGRLKYLAHLDTMRAFMRAITRAGLPVWYTEGYNPQIYLSFALPLSLGYEGLQESFDIYLTEEESFDQVEERLNRHLPEALRVLKVAEPIEKATEIVWADYQLEFYFDAPLEETKRALEEYLGQPTLFVEKKSKRGMKEVDIKEHVKETSVSLTEDGVRFCFRTAAGNFYNINPRLLVQGFIQFYEKEPKHVVYTRTAMLNGEEKPFR